MENIQNIEPVLTDVQISRARAALLLETSRTMNDLSNVLDSLFFTYQELANIKANLEKSLNNEIKSI